MTRFFSNKGVFMIKAILKKLLHWFLGIFSVLATGYYVVCKFVLKINNPFVSVIDTIISILGFILNFIAQHILAILIVVATITILVITYKIVVYKNIGDKE